MTLFELLKHYNPSLDTLPQFAKRHGVGALLYDEVASSGQNPFDTIGLMRLSGYAQKQAKAWMVQKENIGRLSRFCKKHGINMLIFKGYAMSRLYDKPELRKSGDVDVFFFTEKHSVNGSRLMIHDASRKMDELVRAKGKEIEEGNKHSSFDIRETHIENHHHFVGSEEHHNLELVEEYLLGQINDNDTQSYDTLRYENCLPGDRMVKSDEWPNVYYPSPNFNAVFLSLHMGEHFVNEGSSLRQLIDWVVFLKKCGDQVDWPKVYQLAEQCGYRKWLDVLNNIAHDYFDVPCSKFKSSKFKSSKFKSSKFKSSKFKSSKFKSSNVPEIQKYRDSEIQSKVLTELVNSKPYDRDSREHTPFKYLWNRTIMTIHDGWKIRMIYDENPLRWYLRHAFNYLGKTE